MEDVYPGDDWNFVFGEASPKSGVAIFSFARHNPNFFDIKHQKDQLTKEKYGLLLRRSYFSS